MIKAKEEYTFNEAELAFLVFKWIGQNIRINFNDEDLDNPINAYTSGEGTPKALSSLFNNICTFFKINSDSISGYLKWINSKDDVIVSDRDYTWNYIEINGEYYLIDVSKASDLKLHSEYMYLDFGTNLKFLFVYIFQRIVNGNYYLSLIHLKNLNLWPF